MIKEIHPHGYFRTNIHVRNETTHVEILGWLKTPLNEIQLQILGHKELARLNCENIRIGIPIRSYNVAMDPETIETMEEVKNLNGGKILLTLSTTDWWNHIIPWEKEHLLLIPKLCDPHGTNIQIILAAKRITTPEDLWMPRAEYSDEDYLRIMTELHPTDSYDTDKACATYLISQYKNTKTSIRKLTYITPRFANNLIEYISSKKLMEIPELAEKKTEELYSIVLTKTAEIYFYEGAEIQKEAESTELRQTVLKKITPRMLGKHACPFPSWYLKYDKKVSVKTIKEWLKDEKKGIFVCPEETEAFRKIAGQWPPIKTSYGQFRRLLMYKAAPHEWLKDKTWVKDAAYTGIHISKELVDAVLKWEEATQILIPQESPLGKAVRDEIAKKV